ncbi:NTP transferase domain-containing protein [Aldersonia sp. NBC_00410]|uniref:NTP transferase domain-containing protein n=1 Tax=Aldersonia sp. NBC_00410 TaxID=2975954 RepID=UPI00225709FD|nr:NTP transferase domain-containing protein [Aldersonia sp. NBC_00410]MCX5044590.1 NTP transferase domain-containing protein [Aldersonia sp. NBC_00410]
MTSMRAEAIVLAGGRASRMGGVDKPAIVVAGRSMLDTALAAVDWCERIAVVGPQRNDLPESIVQTQEHPPGSGPVAGIVAGLAALPGTDGCVVVLAADLPILRADTVRELARQCAESHRPAFAVDVDGRVQYLVGVWPHDVLAHRLAELGAPANRRMGDIVPAEVRTVRFDDIVDCDTPDDVAAVNSTAQIDAAAAPLSLVEARQRLREGLSRIPARSTEPQDALDATLVEPLIAAEALPRVDISAMDGYAVAGSGPWRLRTDVGYAGGARPDGLRPGEAVRIATGAHLPEGATAVLRDEFAAISGDRLDRGPEATERDDIRRRGEDWTVGERLAEPGTPIGPALVSVAASAEVHTLDVRGPVRAHVVVTGDEIRRDGPLHDGQTRDSIGPVLPIFLAHNGIRSDQSTHLRDTATGFDDLFGAVGDIDLLIVVGATGGGAADQLRGALQRARARMIVPRLACRPGGSTLVAELPGGVPVLGLPGNPYAALAALSVLAPAIVEGLTARRPRPRALVTLHNAGAGSGPATRLAPVFATADGWAATPSVRTAHLGGLVGADGLVVVPPNAQDGDEVEFVRLPS